MDRNVSILKDIRQQKKEIREQYRAIRKSIDSSYASYASESLIDTFNHNLSYIKGEIIAAYISIDGEINVIPLMDNLFNLGYKVAVPSKNKLLTFEEWKKAGKSIVPDTVIAPVIAFDNHCNRLGFGGGWYDQMIKNLRPLVIGVAYEKQYCKDLSIEEHDQKVDIIITEICVRYRS
ncbi:MAG: 5-formyltetrahydrofolate cyclo-ligase [Wolbachia sp.]|nr:5-formyltetrahydrofolate cyclo-ligase [Wolbachia sp.]